MQHESHLLVIFLEIAGTTTSAVETMDISNNGNDNSSFVTTNNYKSTQESAMCKLTIDGGCALNVHILTDHVTLSISYIHVHVHACS